MQDLSPREEDIVAVPNFANLYDNRGQPGWSPWRLALVIVMLIGADGIELLERLWQEETLRNLRQLIIV